MVIFSTKIGHLKLRDILLPMNTTKLLKRGLLLEYGTLTWNVVGCWIIILIGLKAHSLALFGFGIDSVIEILASIIVIWQLKAINKDKEKLAEKLIGISFIFLSLYIVIQTYCAVTTQTHPHASLLGIIFLTLTAITMFLLAYGKKTIGKKLHNRVLITEAKVTVIDGFLAVSVLVGLILNAYFGLWWADSISSLVIVFYGIKEAVHVLS
jgi:divalent metal cation (Fe/Co/Zn/Cd) transporter